MYVVSLGDIAAGGLGAPDGAEPEGVPGLAPRAREGGDAAAPTGQQLSAVAPALLSTSHLALCSCRLLKLRRMRSLEQRMCCALCIV